MSNKRNRYSETNPRPVVDDIAPNIESDIENANVEFKAEEPASEPVKNPIGKVIGCQRLRVRTRPVSTAKVKTTIPVDTKVEIDNTRSTDEFYSVRIGTDPEPVITGYCMKQFIEIEK